MSKKVQKLIKEDRLSEAIKYLLEEFQENAELLNYSARLSQLQSQFRNGIIENSAYLTHRNKLRFSILEFMKLVPNIKFNNSSANESDHFSSLSNLKSFQVGGAIGEHSVYIERETDHLIKERLKRKKHGLITLEGPRQIGKTSALTNISRFARNNRFEKILNIDLTVYNQRDIESFWQSLYFDLVESNLIDYEERNDQIFSSDILQTKLLQINKPTLITIDETDGLPNELLENLTNLIYNVTKMQLRGHGGFLTFLISFVPFRKYFKSNIIKDFEIGFHTRLSPFNLTQTQELFLQGNLDLPIQDIIRIFNYTGGFPYPCQSFASGLQRKIPENEIIESLLPIYSYNILRNLTEEEKRFIVSILKQKPLNKQFAGSLMDRQIVKQVGEKIEFSSLLIEKIMNQNFDTKKRNKKWWKFNL